jgi:hypothetical protein
MATAYIPSWGFKDPNDVRPKRFDAAGALAELGNPTVTLYDVFVDGRALVINGVTMCADGLLVITAVAYDPISKCVTFVWSGGTLGQTYLVTCRLNLAPTWQIDQSATVTIGDR